MASIEIKGVNQLIRKLGEATAANALRPPMERSVMRLQRDMADYPPQRPGSAYVRTGTLGRRWTKEVTQSGGGLVGKVGNNTAYGPFVQSQQFQADVHRNRWQTDEQVVKRNEAAIVQDFRRAIEKALK